MGDTDPHKLQSQLNDLSVWLKIKKLSINIKETRYNTENKNK